MKLYRLALSFLVAATVIAAGLSVPAARQLVVDLNVPRVNQAIAALDMPVIIGTAVALFTGMLLIVAALHGHLRQSLRREVGALKSQLYESIRAKEQLAQRILVLEATTRDMEAFKRLVSNDLRSARQSIDGFSQALLEDYERSRRDGDSGDSYASNELDSGTVSQLPEWMPVEWSDWLPVLRRKYLQDFVKNGGASVKFIIPWDGDDHEAAWEDLQRASEDDGYVFARVDAATTKVHMIDKLFHQVARQINWDGLARDFLRATLAESSYLVPNDKDGFSLLQVADLNGLPLGEMRATINTRLMENLSQDHAMTDDFRSAMLKLCQAQLDPQDLGAGAAAAVKEWLVGDIQVMSALKSVSIFHKIGRHTGRDLLASLSYWLRLAGKCGLVLGLDISRLLVDKRHGDPDGSLYYNTASVVDAYEALRQFVDSTDEFQYCLIAVFAPPGFLTDEDRGARKYDALYLRIWDEVHGRLRVNPLSPLIRVSLQPQQTKPGNQTDKPDQPEEAQQPQLALSAAGES